MHLVAKATIVINVPAAEVFNYIVDLTHFADWFPGVLRVEDGNDRMPTELGKSYREFVRLPGGRCKQITIDVVAVDEPRRLVTEGQLKPLLPRMEIELRKKGTACEIQWAMFSRNSGLLSKLFVLPLARRIMKPRAAVGVAQLKALLENA